jgi:hypothetical protein
MKHHPHDATESWSTCRKAFVHRAAHFPELGVIPGIIDWLIARGLSSSLYGGISLDNLVISDTADWRAKAQRILIMPRHALIELRYYSEDKLVEKTDVTPDRVCNELDRLLPKLLRDDKVA